MAEQEYPTLNEIAPSWADVQTSCLIYDGPILETADYSAISWKRSVDIGKQRGAGGMIRRRTTGMPDYEAKATFYRSGHLKLFDALSTVAPKRSGMPRVSLVGFDILIRHTPPGDSNIYEVKIEGCRLSEDSADMKEGADPDQVEIALNPVQILTKNSAGLWVVLL